MGLALWVAGCATVMTGHSDLNRKFDFAGLRTFSWMNPAGAPAAGSAEFSAMTMQRIREAIHDQLIAKGYTQADTRQAADFIVSFTVGTRDKLELDTYPMHYHGPWYWYPYYWADSGVFARTYTEGTLGIDIFDQKSGSPVWSGWVRKRVLQSDRDNPNPVIREAVSAVLANFPPTAALDKK